ncbi:MAG: sodium-dependent transporter [Candidatus Alectryocaccobium sp.]|nr:sodium-dependent transporter [Lachnospiraceae bacterium]MDY6222034.1 sodium-dependent transporter [Candidatus Alectryocaccobium sp.]
MHEHSKRNSFSGSIGFVMAAAGSAVGLGNIWRFPYLAAKDGGGLFIVIYIVLALTFGFALLTTDIAIGRKTKKGPLSAYKTLNKKSGFIGVLSCIIPMMILPYYCAIGGWVIKYFVAYISGHGAELATDTYFSTFISGTTEPIVFILIFLFITAFVVFRGVNKGIESLSKILMPILLVLIIIIAIFSLTLSHTDANGVTRTGMDGFKILFIPDLSNVTPSSFVSTLVDAMGQLFYSLSVAMGIMIAYGSYVKDDTNLNKSINQIEIFDTLIAILAGVMIIPAVFTFMGTEGMTSSGPGLMFISLPKVFSAMGSIGNVVGAIFFAMVLFAAVTSSISIMEAIVSSFMDEFHISRNKAAAIETVIAGVVGIIVCLGYNLLYFNVTLPNGASAQILDVMDYLSNNAFMPVVSISTCILIGWVLGPKSITDEIEKNGVVMRRKTLYNVMIRFIAPILLILLFLKSIGIIVL